MDCGPWIDAISALADGEDPGVEQRLVDAHLASCASCRAFAAEVGHLTPRSRLAAAPHMPDLSRRVVKLNAMADRASRWGMVRALLGFVAAEILVLALPALVLGRDGADSGHAARHVGAFSVAYAVGLLVVVVRPARARTILPVAAVLAGALAVTAIVDVAEGHIPLLSEATHLPELLSVLLVWLLARPAPDASGLRGTRVPRLRAVDDEGRDGRATG